MSSFKTKKSKSGSTKEGRLQAKINKKAGKARELRRLADASERNNFSGKISESKAERMRKKAARLSAKTKKIHNTKKETPSQKDYANKAKNQKLKEAATKTPLKMNTMFKMTPGSKEVDSGGTFKNDAAVLNMGSPSNYGTPDSAPLNRLDPDENKKVMDYRQGKGRVKVTTSRNSRGAGKLASGTGETNQKITGYGETNTKVRGSRGSRVATDGRGNNARVVKEGVLKSHIKSKGVQLGNIRKADSKK